MKIEQLNAFKLIEAPYLAELLSQNKNEEFMNDLKQSEKEIVNKIIELIDKVNEISECLEQMKNDNPEHKEKITLSEAERIILENIDKEYKWIARDEGGDLYIYVEKPIRRSSNWGDGIRESEFLCYGHLFQFITWEDSEPYNIEELLKCGD